MFDKNLDNFLNDKITDFSEISKNIGKKDVTKGKTLDNLAGISISISTPNEIRDLSYGKVLISETINYRTQRPERGGLFCEQIFGPKKNYECACGKYKRIRYKGIVCERCGVEVTKSTVRRERMAHIDLYTPIVHYWFLKSVPSRIGLLLDLSVRKLEEVVYFASYLITDVYDDKLKEARTALDDTYKVSKAEIQKSIQKELNNLRIKKEEGGLTDKQYKTEEASLMAQLDNITAEYEALKDKLSMLIPGDVVGELDYRILKEKFPHVFKGGTGAEYLRILLERINLEDFIKDQQLELNKAPKTKRKKILQKIKLASNLLKSGQEPKNFVLEALPILPPDLRPMIQLDGGRFASSDLNDLYRRVINRNNRLKKLMELGAPEVILKNEKRMLQESVDMLISGKTRTNRSGFFTSNKKELKSLTEVLKGKKGRFRQNLLGKRVDYSGRSVIVVGPKLKLDECGIPKEMAIILFKPFVIGKLIEDGLVYNVKHRERIIEDSGKEVWDALDEVIEGRYVLLNRAPTLHRLSIQAFKPVLVDGKAIQLHPLNCTGFNRDFDGDAMAVHLPITDAAQKEARELMVTSKNLLSPASGEPIVTPSQDMILGCYYTSIIIDGGKGEGFVFGSIDEMHQACNAGVLSLRAKVRYRIKSGEFIETSYGRLLFNEMIPEGLPFVNKIINKGVIKKILSDSFEYLGEGVTAKLVDDIKNFGYKYSTISGLSISAYDMISPENRQELIDEGDEKVKLIQKAYWNGLLNDDERYRQSIDIWADVKKVIEGEMKHIYDQQNHIYNMIDSGARGNWGNLTQLRGMKGLVASTSGATIELPIKSTLKKGFSTLEYFIATHGGRKGKSDTALKTAQSGYLTRRLVDSSQNIIIKEDDCGTFNYSTVDRNNLKSLFKEDFESKIFGRTLATDLATDDGKVLAKTGFIVNNELIRQINNNGVNIVSIYSPLTCESEGGVCKKCYGFDLGSNTPVLTGTPVGVIAAQSIGEPGTQLTMRTFHSGGVAQAGGDMTQGLARVEELFEARIPKNPAIVSDIDGKVSIKSSDESQIISVKSNVLLEEEYFFPLDFEVLVKQGASIKENTTIAKSNSSKQKIVSNFAGIIKKIEDGMIIVKDEENRVSEYEVEVGMPLLVRSGDSVEKGQKLIEGHINLQDLMHISGVLKTQEYIVDEIKSIYTSQGQTVNSKHIELIVRQMFSKVRILEKGDGEFYPGDIVDMIRYKEENDKLMKHGKKPSIGERLLLGITRISLHTDSWLSRASFQETVRVLVEGAVSGKIDNLTELKENVIIGRLIPAGKQYRKMVGIYEDIENTQDAEEDDEDVYFDKDEVDVISESVS